MASQPIHEELFNAVKALCTGTITEVEDGLAKQRESDQVAARRLQEEQKQKAEEVRMAAEREEKERQEKAAKMEQDRREIEAVERALNAKKQALRDAEKAAGNGGDDSINDVEEEEDNDEGSNDQHVRSCTYLA
jgi:seryl-tRNA synthetase